MSDFKGRHLGDVLTIKYNAASARAWRAENRHHQSGFTSSIRADNGGNFALVHHKINALQSLDFAVISFNTFTLEKNFTHLRPAFLAGGFLTDFLATNLGTVWATDAFLTEAG